MFMNLPRTCHLPYNLIMSMVIERYKIVEKTVKPANKDDIPMQDYNTIQTPVEMTPLQAISYYQTLDTIFFWRLV